MSGNNLDGLGCYREKFYKAIKADVAANNGRTLAAIIKNAKNDSCYFSKSGYVFENVIKDLLENLLEDSRSRRLDKGRFGNLSESLFNILEAVEKTGMKNLFMNLLTMAQTPSGVPDAGGRNLVKEMFCFISDKRLTKKMHYDFAWEAGRLFRLVSGNAALEKEYLSSYKNLGLDKKNLIAEYVYYNSLSGPEKLQLKEMSALLDVPVARTPAEAEDFKRPRFVRLSTHVKQKLGGLFPAFS